MTSVCHHESRESYYGRWLSGPDTLEGFFTWNKPTCICLDVRFEYQSGKQLRRVQLVDPAPFAVFGLGFIETGRGREFERLLEY